MSIAVAHRIRWVLVWVLIVTWFVGLAFRWFGDWLNLVLLAAIALLAYELLAEDQVRSS